MVPEPGTRHLEEMAASQTPTVTRLTPTAATPTLRPKATAPTPTAPTPTAPTPPAEALKALIKSPRPTEEGLPHGELVDTEEGGEDIGSDSETVKEDSDDEGGHKNLCDEVKDTAGESEGEKEDGGDADVTPTPTSTSTESKDLEDADLVKLTEECVAPATEVLANDASAAPPTLVDTTCSTSDDDDDEDDSDQSFYDSPEDPDRLDTFSVP
jgi:hypothetical protein